MDVYLPYRNFMSRLPQLEALVAATGMRITTSWAAALPNPTLAPVGDGIATADKMKQHLKLTEPINLLHVQAQPLRPCSDQAPLQT